MVLVFTSLNGLCKEMAREWQEKPCFGGCVPNMLINHSGRGVLRPEKSCPMFLRTTCHSAWSLLVVAYDLVWGSKCRMSRHSPFHICLSDTRVCTSTPQNGTRNVALQFGGFGTSGAGERSLSRSLGRTTFIYIRPTQVP